MIWYKIACSKTSQIIFAQRFIILLMVYLDLTKQVHMLYNFQYDKKIFYNAKYTCFIRYSKRVPLSSYVTYMYVRIMSCLCDLFYQSKSFCAVIQQIFTCVQPRFVVQGSNNLMDFPFCALALGLISLDRAYTIYTSTIPSRKSCTELIWRSYYLSVSLLLSLSLSLPLLSLTLYILTQKRVKDICC